MNKPIAFVLGLCPNGLGVIRSLGENKVPVKGFDYKLGGPGFFSKYAVTGLCPNPYAEPDRLCEFLVRQGKQLDNKGIFFPTSDEFVIFLSRHRNDLTPYFHLALPSKTVIESLLNKRWQYDMASRHGIAIPQTLYPEQAQNIAEIVNTADYPVIVKPCHTYLWKEKGFGVKGYRAENETALEKVLGFVLEKQVEVIVQSIIPGPASCFYETCCYLDKGHIPLAAFIKKKLRQFPNDMGLGSLMESVRNDELSDMTINLFKGIDYHGPGEVEYKKDPRDDTYKMIEINARLTLQNRLADCCGINLPFIQYRDVLGHGNSPLDRAYPEHIRWLWAEIDLESFKVLHRMHQISFAGWLRSIAGVKTEALFSTKDLIPFFRTVLDRVRNKFIKA